MGARTCDGLATGHIRCAMAQYTYVRQANGMLGHARTLSGVREAIQITSIDLLHTSLTFNIRS